MEIFCMYRRYFWLADIHVMNSICYDHRQCFEYMATVFKCSNWKIQYCLKGFYMFYGSDYNCKAVRNLFSFYRILHIKGAQSDFSKFSFWFYAKDHHQRGVSFKFQLNPYMYNRFDFMSNLVFQSCLYFTVQINYGLP